MPRELATLGFATLELATQWGRLTRRPPRV